MKAQPGKKKRKKEEKQDQRLQLLQRAAVMEAITRTPVCRAGTLNLSSPPLPPPWDRSAWVVVPDSFKGVSLRSSTGRSWEVHNAIRPSHLIVSLLQFLVCFFFPHFLPFFFVHESIWKKCWGHYNVSGLSVGLNYINQVYLKSCFLKNKKKHFSGKYALNKWNSAYMQNKLNSNTNTDSITETADSLLCCQGNTW